MDSIIEKCTRGALDGDVLRALFKRMHHLDLKLSRDSKGYRISADSSGRRLRDCARRGTAQGFAWEQARAREYHAAVQMLRDPLRVVFSLLRVQQDQETLSRQVQELTLQLQAIRLQNQDGG